jgi:hypothetical protein
VKEYWAKKAERADLDDDKVSRVKKAYIENSADPSNLRYGYVLKG